MHKLLKQAFTLIELLVVIAIIGILSGLIVVSMSGVTQKATIAKAQVFSNSLRNSLMLNLISEWKLDGNANDSWSGGNNGTWYGSEEGTNTSANYRPSDECVSGNA
jgi:prepilin-type N-terminal cleavage/methylation domain-containing protein